MAAKKSAGRALASKPRAPTSDDQRHVRDRRRRSSRSTLDRAAPGRAPRGPAARPAGPARDPGAGWVVGSVTRRQAGVLRPASSASRCVVRGEVRGQLGAQRRRHRGAAGRALCCSNDSRPLSCGRPRNVQHLVVDLLRPAKNRSLSTTVHPVPADQLGQPLQVVARTRRGHGSAWCWWRSSRTAASAPQPLLCAGAAGPAPAPAPARSRLGLEAAGDLVRVLRVGPLDRVADQHDQLHRAGRAAIRAPGMRVVEVVRAGLEGLRRRRRSPAAIRRGGAAAAGSAPGTRPGRGGSRCRSSARPCAAPP